MQTSPWFRANIAKPSSALSRKASSASITSLKKMFGDLPPSSSVTGMMFRVAYSMIFWPTAVEPVKAILAMRGLVASGSPTSAPVPETMFSTPAGKRSWISSMTTRMEAGVCSAGFMTMQLPAARAGAIFQAAIRIGKFHGMI